MTECTTDGISFARCGRRKVRACFDGGRITSDGGGVLLREADRQLGLTAALADCITDPRDQARITHDVRTMIGQRVFGIALGYEDVNDQQTLRDDPLLQLLAGTAETMASPSTLCRFENAVDRKSMARVAEAMVDTFIDSHDEPPEELILDFDATDDRVHGKQEGRFFHGYYDSYCFLPLYVFCGEQLLVAHLRPSNMDASKHARAIVGLLVKKLRAAWPGVRIVIRADSGFCRWKLLRSCERRGVSYIVGIARNKRLQRLSWPFADAAAMAFAETNESQRVFGDLRYRAATWDRKRRVIVKAEHLPGVGSEDVEGKRNTRFIVTDLDGERQELYENLYCARGEMENRIKEQQLGLFADRTSCTSFQANQFRVLLSAASYVLVEHVRRIALRGTELERAQTTRLRLDLFRIGARVTVSARRFVVHLASGYPSKDTFLLAASRLLKPG